MLKQQKIIDWILGSKEWIEKYKLSRKKDKLVQTEENNFGKSVSNSKTCMWSGILGESFVKELLKNLGYHVSKPKKHSSFRPDLETEEAIYEVKTRTWCTPGTCGEKILGTPLKYIDVPILYGKPLKIILVAFQEYEAINIFHLFDDTNKRIQKIIKCFKNLDIEYVCCSTLFNNYLSTLHES